MRKIFYRMMIFHEHVSLLAIYIIILWIQFGLNFYFYISHKFGKILYFQRNDTHERVSTIIAVVVFVFTFGCINAIWWAFFFIHLATFNIEYPFVFIHLTLILFGGGDNGDEFVICLLSRFLPFSNVFFPKHSHFCF